MSLTNLPVTGAYGRDYSRTDLPRLLDDWANASCFQIIDSPLVVNSRDLKFLRETGWTHVKFYSFDGILLASVALSEPLALIPAAVAVETLKA